MGGALGAMCRHLLGLLPVKPESGFPLITLFINLVGAFCIGLIAVLAGKMGKFDPRLLLFLKTGVCGGFTTFSTFSLEAMGLLQDGKPILAGLYMMLSVILCVAAVFFAQAIVGQSAGA
jgi:CrcB protein